MKHTLIILTIITLFSCNNQPENIYSVDNGKTQTVANPVQTDKRIHIRGLGEFSKQDLQEISNYIEGFYKFDCVVESSVPSTKKMYMDNTWKGSTYGNGSRLYQRRCKSCKEKPFHAGLEFCT